MTAQDTPGSDSQLPGFDFRPSTRLIFGNDSVDRAGRLARELGARSVLLVTDPGIIRAGHAQRVERSLQEA
jgi:alcohol dehydrogenase